MAVRLKPMPFTPASDAWLRELKEAGKSDSTLDCYARDIRDVAEAIGRGDIRCLASLDQVAVDTIAGKWRGAGACTTTVCRRFSALRGFAVHLVRHHGMDLSALLSADFPSTPKGQRPPMAENEIHSLLSDDQHDSWRGLRDSALFAVQSSSGLTPAEAIGLDVGDVDLDGQVVFVRETHLARRLAGLSEQSEVLIRQYLIALPFHLGSTDPLFVTSSRKRLTARTAQVSFRRRRLRLGISASASLMGLRHAVGVKLANDGGSPALLASALGVSRSTATRYFDGRD
jgi:site-specific recombinase XerD